MTAKEMFEELGWYLDIETNNEQIVYSYNILDDGTFGFIGASTITFEIMSKSIYLDELECIHINLLKAINKQVEELGWEE